MDQTRIASTELATQMLTEATLFLDNFCDDYNVSLEIAIGITMTAADMRGGQDVARAMQSASNIILSERNKSSPENRHQRRSTKYGARRSAKSANAEDKYSKRLD